MATYEQSSTTTQKIGWAAVKDARRSSKQINFNPSSATVPGGYGAVDTNKFSNLDSFDEEAGPRSTFSALKNVVFGKFFPNCLLVFMPFGYLSYAYQWGDNYVFWFNFLAMVPLASILGDFTEEVSPQAAIDATYITNNNSTYSSSNSSPRSSQLAMHTNQTIGGLINATFGNAVEVVVAVQGMKAGQIRVVQASMLGSVFSNLLLVLGCCFFFGGLKFKEQTFNATSASANISLLTLSSLALVLPTPFAHYYEIENEDVLMISR